MAGSYLDAKIIVNKNGSNVKDAITTVNTSEKAPMVTITSINAA